MIVVMQRLHPDDLVGHLLEQEGWRHLNLPAIAEEESSVRLSATRSFRRRMGGLLHPERESQSALDELKASMGTMEFSAQYQQAPVPAGGNLIKWSWFKFYDQPPASLPSDKVIISWDTALSSSQLADYSACVVLMVRHQSIFILDVIRARLEYPELKRAVLENYHRWRLLAPSAALVIEKKGSGLSLIQDLRRDNIHAIGITPEGIRSCEWPLKQHRSRLALSIFQRARLGWKSSRKRYSPFPPASTMIRSTRYLKHSSAHSLLVRPSRFLGRMVGEVSLAQSCRALS